MAEVKLEDTNRKVKEVYEKGFAALERNNLGYAMDMFTSALDLEPNLLQARRFLRAAQVKQFKANKGGEITHLISSITGLGGVIGVNMALKKDPLKALKASEKLLRSDPFNKTFINLHVQAALGADMPEVAIMMLEIAREHHPKDIELLKRLGTLYLENNLTKKGREVYEVLLSLRPNDQVILKSYKDASALDTMNKGGWNDAGSYRDVMKDAGEATRLEQEAKSVKTTKDVDTLIADSLAKIEGEPQNINYRRTLADLYARDNQFEAALKTLTEAQEMSGGADPQIDRALSAIKLKQYDARIQELEESGQADQASTVREERQTFELQDAADRIKRYPNDLLFRYEYGKLLYENDNLNESIQQLQLAQRNPQRRIRALYYMALCFKQKKQLDIALEQLEKAASELQVMDDTKKDILYELGEICLAMDDKKKAGQYFKEIYSVDIGYRDVAQKIEQTYSS